MGGCEGASDQVLVDAVRGGDVDAFSTLYLRHVSAVRKEIWRICGGQSLLDLTQDVFVRALGALPSLRDPALFRAWLLSIARRVAIDERRGRHREEPFDEDGVIDVCSKDRPADDMAELHELANLVRGTVAGLSRRDATALRLVSDLGFAPDELALTLGVTPGAARVIVHRAQRRLRDALVLELLVRRQIAGCTDFVQLHDGRNLAGAVAHIRGCDACRSSARREVGLRYGSGIQPVTRRPAARNARESASGRSTSDHSTIEKPTTSVSP